MRLPGGGATGSGEAVGLRDGGKAVGAVRGALRRCLIGMDADNKAAADHAKIECDGIANNGRLGGDALMATSMAVFRITEAKAALDAADAAGFGTIVSARSGESEDLTIAHLAVGWDSGQFKVGSFSRLEHMAKWDECLRIEETLATRAVLVGRGTLPF
nr:hypothetical protein [Oceaniglobus trochenteri]